jgi:DNA-binding NarL/FixJ family response regulator
MRILIVDDHALFRDGLRSLLESHDMEVVGEASDGREAVALTWALKPDMVLMDLLMPNMDGLEATKRLTAELPDVKVLILTAADDDEKLFEAIRSGAKGYLLKDLESRDFFTLLDGVARGEPALTPAVARKLLEEFARPTQEARATRGSSDPLGLTDRELDVLEQLVKGTTSNRELAETLEVTENTVKFHMRNILDKLHLHSRAEVVAYALRHRLVDAESEDG